MSSLVHCRGVGDPGLAGTLRAFHTLRDAEMTRQ